MTWYEFCGLLGATLITVTDAVLALLGCSQQRGCPLPLASVKNSDILDTLRTPVLWKSLWGTKAVLMYPGWYAFCVVAWLVLPGDWMEGTLVRNGRKMKYKINAFSAFLLTMSVTTAVIPRFDPEPFIFLFDEWIIFIIFFVMSIVQSVYCYVPSFFGDKLLALGGNSGNLTHDASGQDI